MLIARSSKRSVQRLARSFATIVDNAGVKVASIDTNQPASSVTVLVKAGSRFETKPGVAHGLKNFAFRGSATRSALGTIRESELYGGVLSSTLSREYLALTAEFLRGDEELFVDVLSSWITSGKFARYEFDELVKPVLESELQAFSHDSAAQAIDIAHSLAFRSGLGSSLFASPHSSFTEEDIKSFAHSAFTKSNIAVLGTGISPETLSSLVAKSFSTLGTGTSSAAGAKATSYFGGETRLDGHGGPETVFIGFGATGTPAPETAILAAHLSPSPAVKWSQGSGPLASSIPAGASVQTIFLPYSDASLFGLLIQGQTATQVTEAGKAAVSALKSAATGGLQGEELTKAVAKAKFWAASAVEGRQGLVNVLGPKAFDGKVATVDTTLSALEKVTAASFAKTTGALIKAKPTAVAIGSSSLPHADELGL